MTREIKVGLFVFAAIIISIALVIKSNIFSQVPDNEVLLETSFDNIGGLQSGAAVTMSGLKVGSVIKVFLNKDNHPSARYTVSKDIRIVEGTMVKVSSNSLMGSPVLNILLPADYANKPAILTSKIPSLPSASLGTAIEDISSIVSDVKSVTQSLKASIGPEQSDKIKNIIDNIDKASAAFADIKSSDIQELIGSFKSTGDKLSTIIDRNENNINSLLADFKTTMANLSKFTTTLANGDNSGLSGLLKSKTLATDVEKSAANLNQITTKINSGQGTLGRLINDDTLVTNAESTLKGINGMVNKVEAFKTDISFEGYPVIGQTGVDKGSFQIKIIPNAESFYVVGASSDGLAVNADKFGNNFDYSGQDFGKEIKYIVQFGKVIPNAFLGKDLAWRIGVMNSEFGVGLDYTLPGLGDKVTMSTDLYDYSGSNMGNGKYNPQWDVFARMDIYRNMIYGMAGYSNILNSKFGGPLVGIGIRFADDNAKYLVGKAI